MGADCALEAVCFERGHHGVGPVAFRAGGVIAVGR